MEGAHLGWDGMRGRPFVVAWQAADTAAALKAAYQREGDGAIRQRLHGLWLLRAGWRLGAVAEALGVHYRTVQRWVDWYRDGGMAAVRARRLGGHGQPALLSAEAQTAVADTVATGRFRTAAEVGDWIAETYGIRYRPGGISSLLKRLGCAPKVPRPVHEKADLAEQDRFKRGGLPRRSRRPG
jgi:transposase